VIAPVRPPPASRVAAEFSAQAIQRCLESSANMPLAISRQRVFDCIAGLARVRALSYASSEEHVNAIIAAMLPALTRGLTLEADAAALVSSFRPTASLAHSRDGRERWSAPSVAASSHSSARRPTRWPESARRFSAPAGRRCPAMARLPSGRDSAGTVVQGMVPWSLGEPLKFASIPSEHRTTATAGVALLRWSATLAA
jgi:hypothetical protein